MRALTVRQPWAWAIVHAGKDVENRTRNIAGAYRGLVAIHAGLTDADLTSDDLDVFSTHAQEWPSVDFHRGALIGVVDLVDVHHGWMEPEPCSPWGERYAGRSGLHHLVLANPRPLPEPIPYRGALGLWTVPDDIEARIREQVAL